MKLAAVLHDVRSIHNVGSIFRTADAAGVDAIYCCGITPAPRDRFGDIRADFHKVALGAESYLPWEYEKDVRAVLGKLRADGWKILAVEQAAGSESFRDAAARFAGMKDEVRIALVVGNEVQGLPRSILDAADGIIEIPMFGKKESLNVAVAFGIVAFGFRLAGDTISP